MLEITTSTIKIKRSEGARQAVLLCHGSHQEGDGVTKIPPGLRLCFYTPHSKATKGHSVYNSICAHPKRALGGLEKQPHTATQEQLEMLSENKLDVTTWEKSMPGSAGVHDSFGGGNLIYNYGLSPETRARFVEEFEGKWRTHNQNEVDLIMLKQQSGRIHLSDVFDAIQGFNYSTLHFGPCRVTPTREELPWWENIISTFW